jgi:copper homeostasis protein
MAKIKKYRVEICIDSLDGALAAQRGGADRVELCSDLLEGGITPSAGCIRAVRRALKIGLHVIIRPRGGDFLYTQNEFAVMKEDIQLAKKFGADGVVFGCLKSDGRIDLKRTAELIEHSRPMSVTFHRAFDMCRDQHASLEQLVALGVGRVLTSGGKKTCVEGCKRIADLQKQAAGRIIIMPGGGLTPANVRELVTKTGVSEVHLSARKPVESRMSYRNENCPMGGTAPPSEYSWRTTDVAAVRAVVRQLR